MLDVEYEGAAEIERAWREGLTPDPLLSVSEWSDRHRMLSSKASAEPGRWRTSRTPYLKAIMDCLSPTSPVERVVFMKAAQLGATEMGSNWIGYVIHHAPGPMMAVWPTVDMAKRNSKQRIDPLIEESAALSELISPARSRDSGNTILAKEFRGGVLVMTGANSAVGLRSMPVRFGTMVTAAGNESQPWYAADRVGTDGKIFRPEPVAASSVRYSAVAYSYLPLDADLLGIDPVRLPSDGRVPIFRPGGFAVVGHTGKITTSVSNGQTINCARVRLSRVRVVGHDGAVINTGYSADLEAGTVTFINVAGYSQPVTIEHRIEDMAVVRDVQISGEISFTRALTHEYPLGSHVSSALVAGDLFARVNLVFDQSTWNGAWSDALSGSSATATFNNTQYPIRVTNRGALTERWIVRLTNSTSFEVIGENVGVIATGNTSADCAPNNPATGVPYFHLPALGWGNGWATGNVLRFNTIGAQFPVWVVRTVQQGPESVPDDNFTLLIRGDVDTP